MQNTKGQMGVGMMITLAITVIVALVLLPSIAQNVGTTSTTGTATAAQYNPAAAGSSIDLTGQEYLSTATVVNESGTFNCANNVTIAEGVSPRTGTKRIIMTSVATFSSVYCSTVNVTYNYAPEGYIDDAGGRSMALLITLLAALAIAAVAIGYSVKEYI